jgi:hypothetical protein
MDQPPHPSLSTALDDNETANNLTKKLRATPPPADSQPPAASAIHCYMLARPW